MILVCYQVISVLSSFSIILMRKRELVAFLELYSYYLVTVSVQLLSLRVPLVCLVCVIVLFPDHTLLLL